MGNGNIYPKKNKKIIQKTQNYKEFDPPDNRKANIGIYLFKCISETQKKNEKVWRNLLKDYGSSKPTEEILKDTKKCKILAKHMRNGIPIKWRWETWKSYINLEVISQKNYESISLDMDTVSSDIIKDLDRTFPNHKYFDKEYYGYYGQFSLMRVLGKFAWTNPDIKYCQGMNFLAGYLLIVSGGKEIETFCMLESLLHNFKLKKFYSSEMSDLKKSLASFDVQFQRSLKQLYWHFKINEISEDMWVLKWFITIFTAAFPFNIVSYIWDLLITDGISVLAQSALSILKYFEAELLIKDTFEILQFFNTLPSMKLDPSKVLHPVISLRKKTKSISDNKILPFVHPNLEKNFNVPQDIKPQVPLYTEQTLCEIIEDPSDLPFSKTQNSFSKYHIKGFHQSQIDFSFEAYPVVDPKLDENFEISVILNDLTEDSD
jgi:Rab-GTPase-TBC domain